MPTVKNTNNSGKPEKGAVLTVTGVSSENEAILAVENFLREHDSEQFELVVAGEKGEEFEIRLE